METLTIEFVQKFLQLKSNSSVYNLIKKGELVSVRINSRETRITKESLEDYIFKMNPNAHVAETIIEKLNQKIGEVDNNDNK